MKYDIQVPDVVIEAMANREHDRWSSWYQWQKANSTPVNLERWDRQAVTPYEDLSEFDKDKDREQVEFTLMALHMKGYCVVKREAGDE